MSCDNFGRQKVYYYKADSDCKNQFYDATTNIIQYVTKLVCEKNNQS